MAKPPAKPRQRQSEGRVTPLADVQSTYGVRASWNSSEAGITGSGWMGPGRPLAPLAPPQTEGRRWDYNVGYNLNPRRGAQSRTPVVTFEQLRGFADAYDVLRLLIETRKDQVSRLKWTIKPRDAAVKVEGAIKTRVDELKAFFMRPDKEQWWDSWIRALLEELFVLDAPALYRRRTRGGELYALEIIDGSTIDVLIDDYGRTPMAPEPAYQQRLKGLAATNYSTQDLLYRPRNRRANKAYGYSPVEQIIMTINIALKRQIFQLQYYTEGNVPEALVGVPDTWTPEQISDFQASFDGMMAGNTAMRRRMHFIPSSAAKGYTPTKTDNIFGEGEEWLARVVCYAFSASPQPFVKMMNRATSEQADESATEEGLIPIKNWIKGLVDEVLIDDFDSADLEFGWVEEEELGPKEQDELIGGQVDAGRLTMNEGRKAKGLDPYPDPAFDKPMVKVSTGLVFASPSDALEQAKVSQKELGPPPGEEGQAEDPDDDSDPSGGSPGRSDSPKPKGKGKPEGPGKGGGGAGKAAALEPDAVKAPGGTTSMDRPKTRRAVMRLGKAVARAFAEIADDVAGQVEEALRRAGKAEGDDFDVEAVLARLELDSFDVLIDQARDDFFTVADEAGRLALGQVGATDLAGVFEVVNERAQAFAEHRAAELVGRRRLPDGSFADSRNPAMAITDSTRNMLRETIEQGIADNISADEIADRIQDGAAFSAERARLIARTEIAAANSEGALMGYRAARDAGVDVKKEWLLGDKPCSTCQANAAQGAIDLDQPFQSGHQATPAHPRCECAIAPVVED
jgi:hypothetical protein